MTLTHLFTREALVQAEMLRIEQRERQVHIHPHVLARRLPHEEHTKDLIRPRHCHRPPLMPTRELLARDVTLGVARDGLGEHEREHVRVGAVVHLDEAVQESHDWRRGETLEVKVRGYGDTLGSEFKSTFRRLYGVWQQ